MTDEQPITPEELLLFKEWQAEQTRQPGEVFDEASPMPNATSDRLNTFVKSELSNRTPVTMPREYIWGAAAGGMVLILTAWPVLILGAVLGAFGMYKIGCPCNKPEK